MNRDYCKIVDCGTRIEFAQNFVELDGRIWINPTAEQYERAGYAKNAKNEPEARDGYFVLVDHYEARDGQIFAVYEYEKVTPPPRVFSKLNLLVALGKRDLYGKFLDYLRESGFEPMWNAAQDLSEDYDGFDGIVSQFKSALNLTDAEVDEILGEAVAR